MQKTRAEIKKGIIQLLVRATQENRRAVINLLPAAKHALDSGYVPDIPPHSVLHSWRCLLTLLANVASMQTDADVFFRVSHELLAITDRLVPPTEALRLSARILMCTFKADLYICRLRDKEKNWLITSADTSHGGSVPLAAHSIEESFLRHPVMRTIARGHEFYVVSNNLRGIERGGESLDCTTYKEGYRSRLCFIIRERESGSPFGLVMLYSQHDYGFETFEDRFLARCGQLINLVVGSHVALARDTLEKAAGAMAHYGNNVLNNMRVQAEFCNELVQVAEENKAKATLLAKQLIAENDGNMRARLQSDELESLLRRTDMSNVSRHLNGILDNIKRMATIIKSLQTSVKRPRLLKYVRGVDVLRLDDGKRGDE